MAENRVIQEALRDLRDVDRRVALMAAAWWREALERGLANAPKWPPAGFMGLLRRRNEARERVEMATGVDPDAEEVA